MRSRNAQVAALVQHWQEKIAVYVREKRKTADMKQKAHPVRQTLSLIENAKLNFTLEALMEALVAVGGNISEAFQSKIPLKFAKVDDETIHDQLQDILDKAPRDAQAWIVGNIKTFHDAYVKRPK